MRILVVQTAILCGFFMPKTLKSTVFFNRQISPQQCSANAHCVATCHPPMIAALLREMTSRHRAWAVALLWLLVVTALNVQTAGVYRSTILFAIPVALVSWSDWHLGFMFAAVGVLAAKFGGAIPEPGSSGPLWLDGTLAFTKLCIDAVVINAWGRRSRRRSAVQRESTNTDNVRPD